MSEQHIRTVLREICEELDRCARKVVFPSLVGAGIALAGGCDNGRPVPSDTGVSGEVRMLYGVPDWRPEQPPLPPYGVPFDRGARPIDKRQAREAPPLPPYMAPDAGPPQPDYMAPDDAKPPKPKLDGGPQPLYNAPPPAPPEPKP